VEHISEWLSAKAAELRKQRDSEVMMASEVAVQYISDSHDREAFKRADREAAKLAKAWNQMIALLKRMAQRAAEIEAKVENFYGDGDFDRAIAGVEKIARRWQ
jgi:ribonuclease HI